MLPVPGPITVPRQSEPHRNKFKIKTKNVRVSLTEDEGLASVRRPHILEASGVPEGLVKEQGESDWVACGTLAIHQDDTDVRVDCTLVESDMRLRHTFSFKRRRRGGETRTHVVIWSVEILPIPASA